MSSAETKFEETESGGEIKLPGWSTVGRQIGRRSLESALSLCKASFQ